MFRVVWIDEIEIVVEGATIRATATSGGDRSEYRMARSRFRAYIERAIRQLDECDACDRCQIICWPGAG